MADTDDVVEQISLQRSQDRIREARDSLLAEQAEHQATLRREAEQSQSELEMVMAELKEPERRLVRLHAYLQFLNSEWGEASNRQVSVDLIALRLARYMVLGEAK